MKIKKGDTVIIISGKDRGKTGKITKAMPDLERVVIEGINLKKRHQRARRANQKGQIVSVAAPIHVSNVMLVDPKTGKRTRIGARTEKNKKVRVSKKSGALI